MIEAKLIADSVNPHGDRVTTFLLTYPRFIHSELMTHRAFSRNAASSRAIPVERMLGMVEASPAGPAFWAANERGMQATAEVDDPDRSAALEIWHDAMRDAVASARKLVGRGVHKAIANRLVEPFAHMTTLVTATEYENFFALRAHPAAQQEFQVLAYRMLGVYMASAPTAVPWGGWHVPFGDRMPAGLSDADRVKVATARAARTSYLNFGGLDDPSVDIALHDRLAASGHWSPFEHAARAVPGGPFGNFRGWWQYRKDFDGECQSGVDLAAVYAGRPTWVDAV